MDEESLAHVLKATCWTLTVGAATPKVFKQMRAFTVLVKPPLGPSWVSVSKKTDPVLSDYPMVLQSSLGYGLFCTFDLFCCRSATVFGIVVLLDPVWLKIPQLSDRLT